MIFDITVIAKAPQIYKIELNSVALLRFGEFQHS